MKVKILLVASVMFLVTSCKKEETEPAIQNTLKPTPSVPVPVSDLIGKKWVLTEWKVNGSNYFDSILYSGGLKPCRADDTLIFYTNNTYTFDEGLTKCSPTQDQISTYSWELTSTGNGLILDASDHDSILKLNTDTLLLSYVEVDTLINTKLYLSK